MSEAPAAHYVRRGASSVLRKVFRALPCRDPATTKQSGNLGWTAAWLRAGTENLNGWVPLLGAQAFLGLITLGPKCECSLAFVLPESVSRFGGGFWDAVSSWGLFGKLRDGILLDCGIQFPLCASAGPVCPRIRGQNGTEFPPGSKKASGAVALEAFLSIADECVSCSWLGARRRGRSCIPRRWG